MRTVPFKTVFEGVVLLQGKDPTTAALSTAEEARIMVLINQRVREGWCYFMWPELMECVERPFRETWTAGSVFGLNAECYYAATQTYYKSLQADNTNHNPATETAWWEEVSELNTYLPAMALDQYALGEVVQISKADPFKYAGSLFTYRFFPTSLGIQVVGNGIPATVWVLQRMRPNVFTRVAWSEDGTYSVGDLCYRASTGECYQYITVNGAATWNKLDFPAFLQNFVQMAAFADDLMQDGQKEKAEYWRTEAYRYLENEHVYQTQQQGQYNLVGPP